MDRVMIAAPGSGSGKTIFTCGLLNILNNGSSEIGSAINGSDLASSGGRKRVTVSAFKCGPDYIDPMFHRKVIGVPSENLDSFFSSPDEINDLLTSTHADYGVIEGVMGIYDGIGNSIKGSCYEIAAITETPIILVVDVKGSGNTILSVIKGILIDDNEHLISGIVLNRASRKYAEGLAPLIDEMAEGIGSKARYVGFIPNSKDIKLESRHLGLKLPSEINDLREQVNIFSQLIKENCDVNSILEIMQSAEPLKRHLASSGAIGILNNGAKGDGQEEKSGDIRIAVARDEAFCFYYEDNLRVLRERGAEIVEFSPIHDEKLPENIQGLILGGGYPELCAGELSENKSMRDSIKEAIKFGLPSLAECGGFMYLMDNLEVDGVKYPMVGAIQGTSKNAGKLTRFGYVNIFNSIDDTDNAGDINNTDTLDNWKSIKGHEFHYYDSDNNGKSCIVEKASGSAAWDAFHQGENYFWGYPHLYYRSSPEFIDWFISEVKKYSC